MRRLLAIAVMALTAACGSVAESGTTEAVPDPTAGVVPPAPADPGAQPPVPGAFLAPESTMPPISLPEASGDPELDALGAELAGLEQQLLALDAASLDLGGTP